MPPALKHREHQVLTLLVTGMAGPAIATRLGLSAETVRWYTKQLYRALGVNSRAAAIHAAHAHGLLDTPVHASPAAPVARSDIHFVDSGGVQIAWQCVGEGPVDILLIQGMFSHLDAWWELPEFTTFAEHIGRAARLILFDKRGTGVSDRQVGANTLEQTVNDAIAVLDAAGSRRTFVFGASDGGAAAILLSSMRPERVRGLALFGTSAHFAGHRIEAPWRRHVVQPGITPSPRVADAPWTDDFPLALFAPSRAQHNLYRAWWPRFLRASASAAVAAAQVRINLAIDIRSMLPSIDTPTLVMHRRDDRVVPVAAGRLLAERMPRARWCELAGRDHAFFIDGDEIARTLIAWLQDPDSSADVQSFIGVVLAMGGAHDALSDDVRAVVSRAAPRFVRQSDRGWTAVFDAPTPALRCARALRDLGRGRVQGIALHVGACGLADGAPVGTTVARALDTAALAQSGDVLVTTTLRDILAGADVALRAHAIEAAPDASVPDAADARVAATVWLLDD